MEFPTFAEKKSPGAKRKMLGQADDLPCTKGSTGEICSFGKLFGAVYHSDGPSWLDLFC